MIPNDNREEAIRLLEAYRDDLRTQIEHRKADLDAVMRSIQLLRGTESPPLFAAPQESSYADIGSQAAVNNFLRARAGQAFKPSTIAKELRTLGYQPTCDNPNTFVAMVRTGCIRLEKKGILRQTDVEGKIAFVFPSGGIAT
jgi:hypothetical protein